jgi:hypothetical protein
MILKSLPYSSDLTESSLKHAISLLQFTILPVTLVTSVGQMKEGSSMARKLKLQHHVETGLNTDGWYVYNTYEGIFSPGA